MKSVFFPATVKSKKRASLSRGMLVIIALIIFVLGLILLMLILKKVSGVLHV